MSHAEESVDDGIDSAEEDRLRLPYLPQHHERNLSEGRVQQLRYKMESKSISVSMSVSRPFSPIHEYRRDASKGVQTEEGSRERELQCYRVVYRGVVALLSRASQEGEKSGAYVSYGEVIASSRTVEVPWEVGGEESSPPSSPLKERHTPVSPSSSVFSHGTNVSRSSLPLSTGGYSNSRMVSTITAVQVDEVLTGGYALDSEDRIPGGCFGFIFSHLCFPIAEKIPPPVLCESGSFAYRVTSKTPLNILTGPCGDAPLTRAMAMPGTIHHICLRIQFHKQPPLQYLRLSHRRGWIVDKKVYGDRILAVMTEVHSWQDTVKPRRRRLLRRHPQQLNLDDSSPNVTMLSDDSNVHDANAELNVVEQHPSFFLMRVRAPKGLKILDSPHFQVNRLIHGQSKYSSPISSHSIFHTMTGFTDVQRTNSSDSTIQRLLPRGALFEASKRMEKSPLCNTPGSGSIKLSDNSGWAIIPSPQEIHHQFKSHATHNYRPYEEIGNAIVDPTAHSVWVRILPREGVLVACPPPPDIPPASSSTDSTASSKPMDSDTASSAGSALFEMFRTPKKDPIPIQKIHAPKKPDRFHKPSNLTLPCGLCVQVDPWEHHPNSRQSFCRLRGGQGWIPRYIHSELYSYIVKTPTIQKGPIWFRVAYKRGIKIRRGPSRRAPSIAKRSECGEFLRAEDVYTVTGEGGSSECFAKLYPSSENHRYHDSFRTVYHLTAPAEWVHVRSNGRSYLEETPPPSIDTCSEGWRYNAVSESGVGVRSGPSFDAAPSGKVLRAGESVLVDVRVTPPGERVTWLKLKDGRGWVNDLSDKDELAMIAHSLQHRQKKTWSRKKKEDGSTTGSPAAYNTLITRLFPTDSDDGSEESGMS